MNAKILQINFRSKMPGAEYQTLCNHAADSIAKFPGLLWKIWIVNEQTGEAGGIYSFEDGSALEQYLRSPIVENLQKHPALDGFSIKQFDFLPGPTAVTRGPIPGTSRETEAA